MPVHPEQVTTSGGPGKALADQLNAKLAQKEV